MRFALTLLSLILHHLTAGAAVEPKVISGISTPKIALIANDRSETTKTLLDLAQVELSNDKGLALLERQAIDRVLTEQKLSLSGLVDGNTAVKVGRLLRVDLFAIVETWGAKNEAFAVIVYDAGTGMKFADQSLPEGGKLADHVTTIVEAVRMAVDKRGQGLKNLKTLSVMGVRNADLPRDRDTTCRSLAMIFERRVLGSLNIGILERKRLELLNKEKQLPTEGDNQQLLTSLLVLDLEFGRAKTGKGLRAIAIVSDGAGKELHRVSVEGKETAGADVVEPLVLGLLKYLKGTSYPKPVDRVREANRFVREGEIAWSHKDRIPAIEAMEAGYALDSSNPEASCQAGDLSERTRGQDVASSPNLLWRQETDDSRQAGGCEPCLTEHHPIIAILHRRHLESSGIDGEGCRDDREPIHACFLYASLQQSGRSR